jgi:hypothetical protein
MEEKQVANKILRKEIVICYTEQSRQFSRNKSFLHYLLSPEVRQQDLSKRRYLITNQYGVMSNNNLIFNSEIFQYFYIILYINIK